MGGDAFAEVVPDELDHTNTFQNVVAWTAFIVVIWFLAFPRPVRWLPLGRSLAPLLGAAFVVACGVLTPSEAFSSIDGDTMLLLMGMMLIASCLSRRRLSVLLSETFVILSKRVSSRFGEKTSSGVSLTFLSFCSSVGSVLLTNDGACVFLGDPALHLIHQKESVAQLQEVVVLLAVCTCANISSSCVLTGNPQNAIIGAHSGLVFWRFTMLMIVPCLVSLLVNLLLLIVANSVWAQTESRFMRLIQRRTTEPIQQPQSHSIVELSVIVSTPELDGSDPEATDNSCQESEQTQQDECQEVSSAFKGQRWVFVLHWILIVVSIFSMVLLLFLGFSVGWTILSTALVLCMMDAIVSFDDPSFIFQNIRWPILCMFGGLFILTSAITKTKTLTTIWSLLDSHIGSLDSFTSIALFGVSVVVLSNLIGNVPVVMLVAPLLEQGENNNARSWLLLAWFSTIAGNLTLVGSAANLIVAETSPHTSTVLNFWRYFAFGPLSTFLVLATGTPLIILFEYLFSSSPA